MPRARKKTKLAPVLPFAGKAKYFNEDMTRDELLIAACRIIQPLSEEVELLWYLMSDFVERDGLKQRMKKGD